MELITVLAAADADNTFFLPHKPAEAVVAGLASIIVFLLLWWKGLPAAKDMAHERQERLAGELDRAEAARVEAEAALADVQGRIADAETERQRILTDARSTAEAVRTQVVERANEEAAALVARSGADIESSKHQALADLQAEVGRLALGAAEELIARNLDPATQSELVDRYIEQVGARP